MSLGEKKKKKHPMKRWRETTDPNFAPGTDDYAGFPEQTLDLHAGKKGRLPRRHRWKKIW